LRKNLRPNGAAPLKRVDFSESRFADYFASLAMLRVSRDTFRLALFL
jgi:hypothetical protein